VLVIVDRNVDLVPMLSHSWTYQSLVHDVLKMRLNQITVEVPDDSGNAKPVKKHYDLKSNDFFWAKNAPAPFPNVAEDIDGQLAKYKEDAAEVTRKTGATSLEDLQADTSASAQHLKAALTLLPELRERKAILDMHMNILTALLQGVKDRQIDNYCQIEENMVSKPMGKNALLDLIASKDKGTEPLDKLRLFIIWYLSADQDLSRADFEQFSRALQEAGCDTSSLAYIKRVRQVTRSTMMSSAPISGPAQTSTSTDLFKGFSAISSRLTSGLKEAGIGANFENLVSGVKSFLPQNKDLTLTKITESLMDPQNASSAAIAMTEGYLYFDPRSANARGTMPPASAARAGQTGAVNRGIEASFGQRRQGFSEAIVFTVGGGSVGFSFTLTSHFTHTDFGDRLTSMATCRNGHKGQVLVVHLVLPRREELCMEVQRSSTPRISSRMNWRGWAKRVCSIRLIPCTNDIEYIEEISNQIRSDHHITFFPRFKLKIIDTIAPYSSNPFSILSSLDKAPTQSKAISSSSTGSSLSSFFSNILLILALHILTVPRSTPLSNAL
jgi:hypothetical protein